MIHWFFADRTTGRFVIGQWPNFILGVALSALAVRMGLAFAAPLPPLDEALGVVERIALVLWGADELARGVNPWRRLLGATILVWVSTSVLR